MVFFQKKKKNPVLGIVDTNPNPKKKKEKIGPDPVPGLICKLRVHIKDNNSPHGKFHRLSFPFSSEFPDLNFAPYVHSIYNTHVT